MHSIWQIEMLCFGRSHKSSLQTTGICSPGGPGGGGGGGGGGAGDKGHEDGFVSRYLKLAGDVGDAVPGVPLGSWTGACRFLD